jgi:hypothetical protein
VPFLNQFQRYQRYTAFCLLLGTSALSFKDWRSERRNLFLDHGNVSCPHGVCASASCVSCDRIGVVEGETLKEMQLA